MPDIVPLAEPGHTGYLVPGPDGWVAVDAPLDADVVRRALPPGERLTAAIETSVAVGRIAGGRPLADGFEVPLYAPDRLLAGAGELTAGALAGLLGPDAELVAAPAIEAAAVAIRVGRVLLIGDLDRAGWAPDDAAVHRVAATRLSPACFDVAAVAGSTGQQSPADLSDLDLPRPGRAPLNHDATDATNRGTADLFWADPRFGVPVDSVDIDEVRRRAADARGPTVIDLTAGGAGLDGALPLSPGRLASSVGEFGGAWAVVVVADEPGLGRAAAGFLGRLGVNATYAVV